MPASHAGRATWTPGALTTGARPRPGLLQGELAPADPLASEWDVVVVGAHFAGAVVSRALPGGGRDAGYLFALTHDRGTVLRVAQDLLGRLAGGEADGVTFPDLMPLDVPDAGVRSSPKRPPG